VEERETGLKGQGQPSSQIVAGYATGALSRCWRELPKVVR
jgi:hypothetical protein